jgi:hypothetical protein
LRETATNTPIEKKRNIISDTLVVKKTGLTLEECYALLDRGGAGKMQHKEIFAMLAGVEKLKPLGEWNLNLLTTSYEWNRGLKERGQKENGFEISISKTIAVPVSILYNAWIDDEARKKWLKEKIIFRKATPNKSARITWGDTGTSLSIDFYAKGKDKSQVVVQHLKLPNTEKATEMKLYWLKKLKELQDVVIV